MQLEFVNLNKILLICYWTLIVACSALQISQMCLDLVLKNDKCNFLLSKIMKTRRIRKCAQRHNPVWVEYD